MAAIFSARRLSWNLLPGRTITALRIGFQNMDANVSDFDVVTASSISFGSSTTCRTKSSILGGHLSPVMLGADWYYILYSFEFQSVVPPQLSIHMFLVYI